MTEISLSSCWYWFVLGSLVSYLLGCFNFAVLISKIKHKDIRGEGSGNPGTMNMSRTFGLKIGILNFVCDALKGVIPVLCGYLIFKDYVFEGTLFVVSDFTRLLFGACAVIGHVFPITMKFKGGKGIATTLGLFLCALSCEIWWLVFVGIVFFVLLFTYIYFFEWGSMASLIGVASFTICQGVFFVIRYQTTLLNAYVIATFALLLIINLLTWIAHHKNLYRLMGGEEHRTSIKKMLRKKKNKAN